MSASSLSRRAQAEAKHAEAVDALKKCDAERLQLIAIIAVLARKEARLVLNIAELDAVMKDGTSITWRPNTDLGLLVVEATPGTGAKPIAPANPMADKPLIEVVR